MLCDASHQFTSLHSTQNLKLDSFFDDVRVIIVHQHRKILGKNIICDGNSNINDDDDHDDDEIIFVPKQLDRIFLRNSKLWIWFLIIFVFFSLLLFFLPLPDWLRYSETTTKTCIIRMHNSTHWSYSVEKIFFFLVWREWSWLAHNECAVHTIDRVDSRSGILYYRRRLTSHPARHDVWNEFWFGAEKREKENE